MKIGVREGGIVALSGVMLVAMAFTIEKVDGNANKSLSIENEIVHSDGVAQHFSCTGNGGPTVVLENGLDADSSAWENVVPQVAKTARVCTVDRAGVGNSPDRVKEKNGPVENANELITGLKGAGETGPFVFVGWSYGGVVSLVAAEKADSHTPNKPDDLAGLVLVDGSLPDEYRTIDKTGWVEGDKTLDMAAAEPIIDKLKLDNTPLVVLEAGEPLSELVDEQYKQAGMKELAQMSTNSILGIVEDSTHIIPKDNPVAIVEAVNATIQSARNKAAPLGTCSQVFPRGGVECK